MRRLLLASLLLIALPAGAHAGNYVSLGIGDSVTSPGFAGPNAEGARMGRVMLGQRWGVVSAEAGGFSGSMSPETSLMGLAMDLKLHVGLAGPLEAFGKAGLVRTWLRSDTGGTVDSGAGHELGLGAQLALGAGLGHASLWLEAGRQTLRMETGEAQIDTLGVGLTFGF